MIGKSSKAAKKVAATKNRKSAKKVATEHANKPRATTTAKPNKTTKAVQPLVEKSPSNPERQTTPVPAKAKLVRDSFTLPESDHDLIKQCKKAAIASGRETKKSEVVRAAIRVFSALSTAKQIETYATLQSIAVGRPKAK
jgi:hypothetical protein